MAILPTPGVYSRRAKYTNMAMLTLAGTVQVGLAHHMGRLVRRLVVTLAGVMHRDLGPPIRVFRRISG